MNEIMNEILKFSDFLSPYQKFNTSCVQVPKLPPRSHLLVAARGAKTAIDSSYNYHAVSVNDNPAILSGDRAHGGVALIWNNSIDTPLDTIDSDSIVGITCAFTNCK